MLLNNAGRLRKWGLLSALLLPVFILAQAPAPAVALDAREAEKVVTVLEKLASKKGGSVYYDEDAAEEWYQIDAESSRLIPAAGFSQKGWKQAFDQTMTGFIASIPQAELEQTVAEFIDRISEAAKMTPQQKQEARAAFREEMGKFDAIRERGARYQDIVKPFGQRLREISLRK